MYDLERERRGEDVGFALDALIENAVGGGSVFEIPLPMTRGTSRLLSASRVAQREPAATREIHRRV